MTPTTTFERPEDLMADYLNDRLSAAEQYVFEVSLSESAALRESLEHERKIQGVVSSDQSHAVALPRFGNFEQRITRRSSWLPDLRQAMPIAAALALAVLVGVATIGVPDHSDDFQTLSDATAGYDKPVVRIVFLESAADAERRAFMSEYALDPIAIFPAAHSVDVAVGDVTRAEALLGKLNTDERVRLVRLVDETAK